MVVEGEVARLGEGIWASGVATDGEGGVLVAGSVGGGESWRSRVEMESKTSFVAEAANG